MKKNNIKVSIVVCLSILVSLMGFYCMSIEGQCKIELKGYWDPSGQYHELPPSEDLPPEEELNKMIENAHGFGWSEESIQESIIEWRKELGLDASTSATNSSTTSGSNSTASICSFLHKGAD